MKLALMRAKNRFRGRTALERQLPAQKRMTLESVEQAEQLRDSHQHVGPEPPRLGRSRKPLSGDPHAPSSHVRSTTSRGIARF